MKRISVLIGVLAMVVPIVFGGGAQAFANSPTASVEGAGSGVLPAFFGPLAGIGCT